jgi:23S rRNA (guanosine2251-2'-O)-methyltransferase
MTMISGKHAVRAVFLARPRSVRRVVLLEGALRYLQEFVDFADAAGVKPEVLPRRAFMQVGDFSEEDRHQGVVAFADPPRLYAEGDLGSLSAASTVLVLDQISNPQNFGTIIRSAAFFGVDAVIWLKNRSADLSPTVSQVAVGGVEFVKLFRVTNLARTFETLKSHGFWVYGLDERGDRTLAETEFDRKAVLVVGAEGEGLRRRTKEYCDALVRIPGGRPGLRSLNAGVATAVALAEVFRQRGPDDRMQKGAE